LELSEGSVEELDFQALLDVFRSRGFQTGERVILGHFGTVQTLLTLVFNTPVTVRLVHQEHVSGAIRREVKLMAANRVVCEATSHILEERNRPEVLKDIWSGERGLGQIILLHAIPNKHRLITVHHDPNSFSRKYNISGPGLDIDICESFPRQPFVEAGWLSAQ
jgi:chorismate-pyruvate lyase